MLDTSLRVPAIARYPGVIPAGVVRTEMLGAYDFAPTLLEQVDLEMPDAERLPGRSFTCLLDPEGGPDRDHVVVMAEYGPVRMIHTPAWKYVHRYPYGPHELYDMAHDPGERSNLVDDPDRKEIVTVLRGEMQRWFSRHADPALDGAHEQVTGSGQFLCAGTCNDGVLAYDQSRRIARESATPGAGEKEPA
jgi:arylsulfatase A-like enzyme